MSYTSKHESSNYETNHKKAIREPHRTLKYATRLTREHFATLPLKRFASSTIITNILFISL